jgi:RND family efflux transporter MFP subunit
MGRHAIYGAAVLCVASSAGFGQAPASVSVVTPERTTVTEDLRLTGTLTSERSARLSPRVDGLVAAVRVDAGDRVKAGQTLVELDAAVASHGLNRARADAAEARALLLEAERLLSEALRLSGEGHLPKTDVARREAELERARAAHAAGEAAEAEQAELVRRHTLPAPFAGVIARKLTEAGEWVTRGTPVLELVSTNRLRLDVQAPQERFARIAAGAEVQVAADTLPGRMLPARIVARVPVSDASARTFLVRMVVEDPQGQLLPGTSATASISLSGGTESLVLPRDALLRYPDGTYSVFVVKTEGGRSTAQERRVKVGRGSQRVEILEGLVSGEPVVIRGNETLRNGQAVRVVDAI